MIKHDDVIARKQITSIESKLGGKADWSVVRKGALLYEFVGKNDVMDDIKAARARLASP